MIRFLGLIKRRREKQSADPFMAFIEKAYYKGVRDTVIAIAWGIIKKFIEPGEDMADVYMKLYESAWDLEKRSKIIQCIASDGTNEHRSRCIMSVLGLQNTSENVK